MVKYDCSVRNVDEVIENALHSRLSDIRKEIIQVNQFWSDVPFMRGTLEELQAERTAIRKLLNMSTFPLSPFIPRRFPDMRW